MDFTIISTLYELIQSKQTLLVNASVSGVLVYIGPVLSLLLTIRFMMLGLFTLYNPGVGEPLSFLIKEYLRIVIILSFATSAGWYQQSLIYLALALPDSLVNAVFVFDHTSASNLVTLLEQDTRHCLDFISQAFGQVNNTKSNVAAQNQVAGAIMIVSCSLYVGISAGLLITAKLMLGLTLCFGPLALICLIWEPTRALFFSWLATLVRFELLTLLLLMVMGLFMSLFHQLTLNLVPGRDVLIIALSALILTFINIFVFYQVYQLAQSLSSGLQRIPGVSQLMLALAGAQHSGHSMTTSSIMEGGAGNHVSSPLASPSASGLSGRARGSRGS